jgi:hypothetical protein
MAEPTKPSGVNVHSLGDGKVTTGTIPHDFAVPGHIPHIFAMPLGGKLVLEKPQTVKRVEVHKDEHGQLHIWLHES